MPFETPKRNFSEEGEEERAAVWKNDPARNIDNSCETKQKKKKKKKRKKQKENLLVSPTDVAVINEFVSNA